MICAAVAPMKQSFYLSIALLVNVLSSTVQISSYVKQMQGCHSLSALSFLSCNCLT